MPDYSKYRWQTSVGEVKHGGSLGGVSVDYSLLDEMIAGLDDKVAEIVLDIGGETALEASENAPFDTGDLARSYIEESKMTDKMTYTVSDGVPYGIFQELGTSRLPARPHLIPAFEKVEEKLLKALEALMK